MGCDIHAFVEYVSFTDHEGEPYWQCLMSNIGNRDYTFFSLIANCGRGSFEPIFPNRGLPEDRLSWKTEREMWLTIDDELKNEDGFCSEENAVSWGEPIIELPVGDDRVIRKTMHPDLHSHTWLTYEELAQVTGRFIAETQSDYPYDVLWDAVLAAMRALEERGHKTRIIIAFDN